MAFNIFLSEIRFFRRRGEGLSDVLPESMIVVAVGTARGGNGNSVRIPSVGKGSKQNRRFQIFALYCR